MLDSALLHRFDAALNQLASCLPLERQPQHPPVKPVQNALQRPVRHFFAETAWTSASPPTAPVAPPHELGAVLPDHSTPSHTATPLNSALGDYFGQVAWQGSTPVTEAPVPAHLAHSLQSAQPEALQPRGAQRLSIQGFFQKTAWTGPTAQPASQTAIQPSAITPPEDDITHFFSDIHW